MSNIRTELANAFAQAGAEFLDVMGVGGALAAIPNTMPQQYVVAGTFAAIGKVLLQSSPPIPEQAASMEAAVLASADNPSTAGAAMLSGLERYNESETRLIPDEQGDYILFSDVEARLAAPALNPSEVRDQALEEAASICDRVNNHDNPMTARDCADTIRALRKASKDQQLAQSEKGEAS